MVVRGCSSALLDYHYRGAVSRARLLWTVPRLWVSSQTRFDFYFSLPCLLFEIPKLISYGLTLSKYSLLCCCKFDLTTCRSCSIELGSILIRVISSKGNPALLLNLLCAVNLDLDLGNSLSFLIHRFYGCKWSMFIYWLGNNIRIGFVLVSNFCCHFVTCYGSKYIYNVWVLLFIVVLVGNKHVTLWCEF